MKKSELIAAVAEQIPHLIKRDVEEAVKLIFTEMKEALRRDERIEIRGFGSFAIKRRRPREGRNPRTGESVFVPTRRKALFTPGQEMRQRLNPVQKKGVS